MTKTRAKKLAAVYAGISAMRMGVPCPLLSLKLHGEKCKTAVLSALAFAVTQLRVPCLPDAQTSLSLWFAPCRRNALKIGGKIVDQSRQMYSEFTAISCVSSTICSRLHFSMQICICFIRTQMFSSRHRSRLLSE